MKVNLDTIKLREFRPEGDVAFIVNTWLKSYRNSSPMTSVPNNLYYPSQHQAIGNILKDPNTGVVIICSPNDEDQILAYSIFSKIVPVIHFIYTKFPYRGVGCGNMMYENIKALHDNPDVIFCTHVAKKWSAKAKKSSIVYDPFLLSPYILGVSHGAEIDNQSEDQPLSEDTALVQE